MELLFCHLIYFVFYNNNEDSVNNIIWLVSSKSLGLSGERNKEIEVIVNPLSTESDNLKVSVAWKENSIEDRNILPTTIIDMLK